MEGRGLGASRRSRGARPLGAGEPGSPIARAPPRTVALALRVLPATAGAATKDPGILDALDARGAIIEKSGGSLRLSMPANTRVTRFTDRPARHVGTVRLVDLHGIWDASGFNEDPPNAALLTSHAGVGQTHVGEMTKPSFTTGHVSLAFRSTPTGEVAGHIHTHDRAAGRFGRARLFFDDAPTARH